MDRKDGKVDERLEGRGDPIEGGKCSTPRDSRPSLTYRGILFHHSRADSIRPVEGKVGRFSSWSQKAVRTKGKRSSS